MRRVIMLGIFISVLIFMPVRTRGIVFLNIQWNEDTEEWETRLLHLKGEGLSLSRAYQNSYGRQIGLPEGPPFIITAGIVVENTYDDYNEVDNWGSLSVTTAGEGTVPFVLDFRPPDGGGDYSTLSVMGHVSIEGTSSDPIIFKGSYSISNGQWGHNDPSPGGPYIYFTNCVFDSVGYGGTCSSDLIIIKSANLTLDNCRFSNFYPGEMGGIVFCEMVSGYDTPDELITIRDCLFSNIILDDAPPIELRNLGGPFGDVRIESNEFRDVIFDDSNAIDGVLINLRSFAEGRITGNTGSGNTNSAFWIRGSGTADGSMTLRSSEELPFLIGQITVADARTLTVEEGSVLKMSELQYEANFRVYGKMIVEGAIFTSWEDDSIGGDNDMQPEPLAVGYWGSTNEGGIFVGQNATLQMRNSTVRYARSGVYAQGDALVDGCTFQLNEYSGFSGGVSGGIDGDYEITNSTFRNNGNNGISFQNDGLHQTMLVDNVRSIGNIRGLFISGFETNPADITVSRSVFAGNVKAAVKIHVGPGLQACTMTGCNISGNLSAGISTVDYDGDEAILRFESCVIAGNGYDFFTGEGTHGAGINGGRPLFINNTVAFNKGQGYYSVPPHPYGGDEDIANNIFIRNGSYGFVNYNELPSRFSHNLFWENGDGELRIEADEGSFSSVGDLQALGGDYATNLSANPELVAGVEGEVDSVRYLEEDNSSYLFSSDAADDGRELAGLIVRPDIYEDPWFFITRHSGDTLVVAGDITAIAAQGDSFDIFDHHLDWSSAIVDAGNSALPVGPLDIDWEHRIIDGDGNTLPDVDIGADEFSADSITLFLISPKQDDYWVASEKRNITWSAVGIDTVSLYYQAPYHPDSNFIAIDMSLPASGGKYKWTVPDSLSTRCRIMIEDKADPDHSVESDFFTIRSPVLARFALDGEYERYRPDVDGWQIPNAEVNMWPEEWWSQFDYSTIIDPYTGEPYPEEFSVFGFLNAQPDDFPDWPLFVEAFGPDQCYIDTPDGPVYRPLALARWAQVKKKWYGSCFGFGQTSFQAFDDKMTFLVSFPEVDNFDSLYALEQKVDFGHRKTINLVMTRQYCSLFWDHFIDNYDNTPGETVDELRDMLLDETRDDRILAIINNNGAGGHALNPYRVEQDNEFPEYTYIYVYDSNYPGDGSGKITVNTDTDIWSYSYKPAWGGSKGFFLLNPSSGYMSPPVLGGTLPAGFEVGSDFLLGGSYHEFYTADGAEVTISDDSGHSVGFIGSALVNTVPGAVPMVPLEDDFQPPIGYAVPAGDYTVEMGDFQDTLVTFSAAGDSLVFGYIRPDALPGQTDRIICGDVFMIGNYDGVTKTINTRAITAGPVEERVFDLLEISLTQDDSIQFEIPSRDIYIASNFGDAKIYNLGIRSVSSSGRIIFEHANILIPAGTGHQIIPYWQDLESAPVKIYIDTGNDGTIDDSLFVENEYVATLLQNYSAAFKDPFIEIDWRLSEIDEGLEFVVMRTDAGEGDFREIPEPVISNNGLSFTTRDYTIEYGEEYRYRVLYLKDGDPALLFETGDISTPVMPLRLYQNYPNPFNPTTKIRFYLPAAEQVKLEIFDVAGRRVVTLIEKRQTKGIHTVVWDGKNTLGKGVCSGIYFYQLKAGKQTLSRKMVILR